MTPERDDEDILFIHPAQFFNARKGPGEGERRLMVALLEDAVDCYQRHCSARSRHRRRLFREAEQWIMDEHVRGPLSFTVVCELLGLPADHLRRGLRRWRAEHSAAPMAAHPTHAAA